MAVSVVRKPGAHRWRPPAAVDVGLLAGAGSLLSCLAVAAGGRVGPVRGTVPPSGWGGLLAGTAVDATSSPVPGYVLVAAVLALVGLWLLALRRLDSATARVGTAALLGLAWYLPLLAGPPLFSGDVYSYLGQGALAARGLDPYTHGVSALGRVPVALAVDPVWRSAPSPYGPLATLLERWVVTCAGTGAGGVLLLRGVATLGLLVATVLAARLAPAHRRPVTVGLVGLNPVALLQVVSAAHLEGLLSALLLACLVAARRGQVGLALVAACCAGAVKAPALLAVAAVLAWSATAAGPHPRVRPGAIAARYLLVVAGTAAALVLAVPDGLGWLTALGTPGLGHTPAAPTAVAAAALAPLLVWTHLVGYPALEAWCRWGGAGLAAAVAAALVATAPRRPLPVTVGAGLLALALLGPVLYPWYLLWGLFCLAPSAGERARSALAALSAVGATLAIPGLSVHTITTLAVLIAAAALGWAGYFLAAPGGPPWPAQRLSWPSAWVSRAPGSAERLN